MNRELRKFLNGFREPDGMISDLYDPDSCDFVPNKSGAYIFLSQNQKFIYPNGESTLIYIGMSTNLSSRIKTHSKASIEIKSLPKNEILNKWYYSRYHYINSFGCKLFWYTTRGTQNEKNLESELIRMFYDKFYSLPIGNGAFSFQNFGIK